MIKQLIRDLLAEFKPPGRGARPPRPPRGPRRESEKVKSISSKIRCRPPFCGHSVVSYSYNKNINN